MSTLAQPHLTTGGCPSHLKGGEWAKQLVEEICTCLKGLGMSASQFGISEQELDEAPQKAAIAWYRDHFAYIRSLDVTRVKEIDRLKCNLVYCLNQEGISVWDVASEHTRQIFGWPAIRYDDYPSWIS